MKKGKRWYKILAPKLFNEVEIGETLASDPKSLKGRKIEVGLGTLLGDLTKQHIKLKLRVEEVVGDKAKTGIVGYEVARSYLSRLIRKRISKIEMVSDVVTKDKQKIRLKSWIITLHRAQSSQQSAIRRRYAELIGKIVKEYNYQALILTLATGGFQKNIAKRLKKIYPIRYVEVRRIDLL
jgi:small subunit ribosomal protein S3Ae